MYHHEIGHNFSIKESQYVRPTDQKPAIFATNPNTLSNFNELSRQGNQRVRIKKVYHVIKNKVPSHEEFERSKPKHNFAGDNCPECIALAAAARANYIPVQSTPTPLPTFNRPPVTYPPPNFFTSPMPNVKPPVAPPFSARVPLPEAPPLPVYRPPPPEFSLPINRNASSFTPNMGLNNSFNNNNNNLFNSPSQNVIYFIHANLNC